VQLCVLVARQVGCNSPPVGNFALTVARCFPKSLSIIYGDQKKWLPVEKVKSMFLSLTTG